MSWNLIQSDNFNRTNTSPNATAGSTNGVGNGWIDVYGGIAQIANNRLKLTSDTTNADSWNRDFILRPSSENHQDQQIVSTIRYADISGGPNFLHIHRYNNSGTLQYYLFFFNYQGSTLGRRSCFSVNGSSGVQIGSNHSDSLTPGHDFKFTTTVVGVNPTTLSCTLDDVTAGTTYGTVVFSNSDTTDGLQTSGQYGVCSNNEYGPAEYYAQIATYYQSGAASIYSPGPAVGAGSGPNGIVIIGTNTNFSGAPFTASAGVINSQSVSNATNGSIGYTAPTGIASATITDTGSGASFVMTIVANDFSLTPSSQSVAIGGSATYTVAPNGTPNGTTIALSDGGAGGTFNPASLTLSAFGPQSFTYSPASTGTKTITATPSGGALTTAHSAACVVTAGAVAVTVNDANLFWSPYNWRVSGASYAVSQANGAYAKLGFTGTGIKVTLDVSAYGALYGNSAAWPKIRWSIDEAAFVDHQIGPSDGTLTIATGLAAGAHQLTLVMVSTTDGYDRWTGPLSAVKITGFQIDPGASTSAPPLKSMRVLMFGDSITEGVKATGTTSAGDIINNDSQLAWAAMLGKGLQAEYGQIGYGGLGWVTASAGGSPPGAVPFYTPGNDALSSWNKYSAGQSRLTGGLFSPAPDMIFIMLGVNDRSQSAATVTASVAGVLPLLRAAAPSAWIFLINEPPPSNQKAAILAGVTAYRTATPDVKLAVIDLAMEDHFNFTDAATDAAGDGLHPTYIFSGQIAASIAQQAQAAIAAATASNGNHPTIQSHQLKRARS